MAKRGIRVNGVAIRTRQDRVRFIQVRHEESAAFMAVAYARFTGKLGCRLATTGPEKPISAAYIGAALGGMMVFEILPYMEEALRDWRAHPGRLAFPAAAR